MTHIFRVVEPTNQSGFPQIKSKVGKVNKMLDLASFEICVRRGDFPINSPNMVNIFLRAAS